MPHDQRHLNASEAVPLLTPPQPGGVPKLRSSPKGPRPRGLWRGARLRGGAGHHSDDRRFPGETAT